MFCTFRYLLLSDALISVFAKWQQLVEKLGFCLPHKIFKSVPVNHMLVIGLGMKASFVGHTEENAEVNGYFFNSVGPTDSSVANTVFLMQGEIVAS